VIASFFEENLTDLRGHNFRNLLRVCDSMEFVQDLLKPAAMAHQGLTGFGG
jgi:hypothetical protein